MLRLRRRLFNLAAGLSLVLFVATIVLWWRSVYITEGLTGTVGPFYISPCSCDSRFHLLFSLDAGGYRSPIQYVSHARQPGDMRVTNDDLRRWCVAYSAGIGYRHTQGTGFIDPSGRQGPAMMLEIVYVPHLWVAVVFAALSVTLWIWRSRCIGRDPAVTFGTSRRLVSIGATMSIPALQETAGAGGHTAGVSRPRFRGR